MYACNIFFPFAYYPCLIFVTWNRGWVLSLSNPCTQSPALSEGSVFWITAVPNLTASCAETRARSFPGGKLVSYICVEQATWAVEWPICSYWHSPWEAAASVAEMNVPHSLHDHWQGSTTHLTQAVAHPCGNTDAVVKSKWGGGPQSGRISSIFANCAPGHIWLVNSWGNQVPSVNWGGKGQREAGYSGRMLIYSFHCSVYLII